MAAAAMTNREIAEALYVTAKTVDTHLYHVYAKLGISSRRQLSKSMRAGNVPHDALGGVGRPLRSSEVSSTAHNDARGSGGTRELRPHR